MLFINKFAEERNWQKFIKDYTGAMSCCARDESGRYGIVGDEDIWPFIISAFFKYFNVPVIVLTATGDRAGELGREIKSLDSGMAVYQYPGMGTNIFSKKSQFLQTIFLHVLRLTRQSGIIKSQVPPLL